MIRFHIITRRYKLSGTILHSNRDSQYTSDAFHQTPSKAGVTQNLSGVDHCYDNARTEGFFATLKKELLYRIPTHKMKREAVKSIIFKYIFTYYNQTRVYTSNPGGYYRKLLEEQISET
ncbi:IS3 family transposase [Tepidanaerobacter syntrophicus]|uniref:IS3 family transposase n=1 Tax=Tepidanaerobacter syntrophicus TaxID=224999 RepID=UPI002353A3C0|nr:IS3 family transposase [Tepidanaerobacter syntrophicus]